MKETKTASSNRIRNKIIFWLIAVALFIGIFILLVLALSLIAGGIFIVPSALLRVFGRGDFFVSDIPQYTMLFLGGFMLFFGVAIITATVCKICPSASAFILSRISDGN